MMTFAEKLRELAGKATPGPWAVRYLHRPEFKGQKGCLMSYLYGPIDDSPAVVSFGSENEADHYLTALLRTHASAIAALIEKGEKLKTHLEQGWDESDDQKDIAAADTACDEFIAALSALNRAGGDDER